MMYEEWDFFIQCFIMIMMIVSTTRVCVCVCVFMRVSPECLVCNICWFIDKLHMLNDNTEYICIDVKKETVKQCVDPFCSFLFY